MRIYLIVLAAIVSLYFPWDARAQPLDTPPGPDCRYVLAKERDQARITFSAVARETISSHTTDGNYENSSMTTRFDGAIELDPIFDYWDCRGGKGAETESDAAVAPSSDKAEDFDPIEAGSQFEQSMFMMEQMSACSSEGADPALMATCIADAVDLAQDMADTCLHPEAETSLPVACTIGGDPVAPGEDEPLTEPMPPDMPVEIVTGTPPAPSMASNTIDDSRVEIFQAVSCVGVTTVTGSGSGYDQSYMRQPHYSFAISGNWTAPRQPGGSSGCSAGAIINVVTGEVKIYLQPGPRNIAVQRSFNNFRGVEEQPQTTFEALDGRSEFEIHTYVDEDMWAFGYGQLLPVIVEETAFAQRRVETELTFKFFTDY